MRSVTRKPPTTLIGGEDDGQETNEHRSAMKAGAGHQGRSHQRDSADRVRAGHQRRVQRRRDFGDHFETDEYGQDKNCQADDQRLLAREIPRLPQTALATNAPGSSSTVASASAVSSTSTSASSSSWGGSMGGGSSFPQPNRVSEPSARIMHVTSHDTQLEET